MEKNKREKRGTESSSVFMNGLRDIQGGYISEDVDRNGTSMLFQCVTILAITVVNSAVFLQSMLHNRLKEIRYIGISAYYVLK